METVLMIGGEAGQGVQSLGFILSKLFARDGFHIYSDQDYESRVRGGHNFYRIRIKDSEVNAIHESLNLLLALNLESIELHRDKVRPDGVIVFDNHKSPGIRDHNAVGIPFEHIAEQETGNKVMANTVALGACLGLLNYDLNNAESLIREVFGSEGGEANIKALHAGNNYVNANFHNDFHINLKTGTARETLLINGNEALALGAIAAGCKFISAYPMTPASSIMEYMAAHEDLGLVAVQTEDEICAINMAIGAGYAGVRAMTATSGSGLCLMVEGLGLAGLTETPIVIVDAQRPGPAVGLPTRTEQGDLQFVLSAHHGDFPRVVLAPSTIRDAFYLTIRAFNLAEQYQVPVIILTDHLLASSYQTVLPFDLQNIQINRGDLYHTGNKAKTAGYKRHLITPSGISPRAFPGMTEALVITDSDEHDEDGHMIEDAKLRTSQVDKRLRKNEGIRSQIKSPYINGPDKADITLISWGSTYGAVHEAVESLNREGVSVNMMHITDLWPFPAKSVQKILDTARHSYVVEGNAVGQLARLIRTETGIKVDGKILKYDGRPFIPSYIIEKVRKGEVLPW